MEALILFIVLLVLSMPIMLIVALVKLSDIWTSPSFLSLKIASPL